MDKQNAICPLMGCYSDIKRNAATRVNLENMLNEKDQTQKAMLCDCIYIKYPELANPKRQKDWWLSGLQGRRNRE
jgi:hypothetical protein